MNIAVKQVSATTGSIKYIDNNTKEEHIFTTNGYGSLETLVQEFCAYMINKEVVLLQEHIPAVKNLLKRLRICK